MGARHVALGSDLDGSVSTQIDVGGPSQITQGLLDAGFEHDEIRLIMGKNVVRLMNFLYLSLVGWS